MHRLARTLAFAAILVAAPAFAAQSLIDQLRDACGDEVRDLCADISPGNGRLVACLYANENQLAPRCSYVLYQASPHLGDMIAGLTRMANACRADVEQLCQDFQPGQGGIANCLRLRKAQVSAGCNEAIAASGVETKTTR
jgi:hypothetical protein